MNILQAHEKQMDLLNKLVSEVAVEDEETEDVGDGTKVEREELSAE